tara:strand:+ start:908 stop:1813 length:906 start_codon:yes stop_codon:yes gene_type:complete
VIDSLEKRFSSIQKKIKNSFSELDKSKTKNISDDFWTRDEGGGGNSFVISDGEFFDNCAVNFSSIFGNNLPDSASSNRELKDLNGRFQAMGVSVISHPKNPNIPTSHMNVRLFLILNEDKTIQNWWIGGGYDLTPYITHENDFKFWHRQAKKCLDKYDTNFYEDFSKKCNEYFYIKHRRERRGIGGIFFDNFNEFELDKCIEMLEKIANTYLQSYLEICKLRSATKFSDKDRNFQKVRRGRYVEFNLIYDRGTTFGLQSKGRIESILSSLPINASWRYIKHDDYKNKEEKLLRAINKDWNV